MIRLTSVCVFFLCWKIVLGFIVHQLYRLVCVCVKTEKWKRKDTTTEHKIECGLCLLIITFQTLECCCALTCQPMVWEDPTTPSCYKCCKISWVRDPKILQSQVYIQCPGFYFLLHYVDVWLFLWYGVYLQTNDAEITISELFLQLVLINWHQCGISELGPYEILLFFSQIPFSFFRIPCFLF